MNKIINTALALLVALPTMAQYEEVGEQKTTSNVALSTFEKEQSTLWNFGWRFKLGADDQAMNADYDDSAWRQLDLPHDFQFEQPWGEEHGGARGFKPMCEGWYRKTFSAPEAWKGKEVLVDFGGVMYYSDVYINGHKVASSEYGYCGYEAEISKHLRYGADNVIAVYANTGKKGGSRWYTGGGIFRDVYLRLQNPTHIGRHGLFVSTPEVSDQSATVAVEVDVWNFRKHDARVRVYIKDASGKLVAECTDTMEQRTKHQHDELKLPLVTIDAPHRWDIDDPYLYTVEAELWSDGELVDRRVDQFGVRTLEWSKDFGFKLNGRKVFLKGIANHHDLGALGVACFDKALERQLRMLKSYGFNSIRCSHNPYSASLTKICDRLGMLVVDELIDKWSDKDYWGGRKPFMQIWPDLIQEWIKRDRNCPSVVMWSLGNELQIRTGWSGYDTNDWGITTYNIFNQVVKRYDPTRKTTVAQHPSRAGAIREEKEIFNSYFAPPELAVATEIASFNYQWDRYPAYFEYAPNMILYQSEAVTNQLTAPFFGMDQDRTVGLAYWGAIEYWGESNKWPKKGWNYAFFSHTLEPFPQAFHVKGAFEPETPMVRIGVSTGGEVIAWNGIDVGQKTYTSFWNCKEGSKPNVTTFTNAEEVELIVNGESLGRKANSSTDPHQRNVVTWEKVPYGQGGTLTAVAYNGGREVARHEISTAGEAKRLVIEAETPNEWTADGMDLQYFNIRAVDSKGRQVPFYDEELSVDVAGEATFVAMDNGDHYTDELFAGVTTKRMQQGYMQVILRSTRQKGKVTLGVKTPTMKASVKLQTR